METIHEELAAAAAAWSSEDRRTAPGCARRDRLARAIAAALDAGMTYEQIGEATGIARTRSLLSIVAAGAQTTPEMTRGIEGVRDALDAYRAAAARQTNAALALYGQAYVDWQAGLHPGATYRPAELARKIGSGPAALVAKLHRGCTGISGREGYSAPTRTDLPPASASPATSDATLARLLEERLAARAAVAQARQARLDAIRTARAAGVTRTQMRDIGEYLAGRSQ